MLKYSVGLDISAKTVHACISSIDNGQKVTVVSSCKIDNSKSGFKQLDAWVKKHCKQKDTPLVYTMEATGVYYENCALYLFSIGCYVSVILANKAKKWMQSEGIKSKNDKIDAAGLSKMGAEKALEQWQPASEYYYQLRALTRQHQALQEHKTAISNQRHAEEYGMYQNKQVIRQLTQLIKLIDKQIAELAIAIKSHLESDSQVAEKVENICKIKGMGMLTVAVVLAETNGLILFKNAPQLVSYAGYDVVENESGTHKGKTRISKKGNPRIRRALHMPALSVVTHKQEPFIGLFNRVIEKNPTTKMKGYVAVQKKLLVLVYALWTKNEAYNSDYRNTHTKEQEQVLPLGSAVAEIAAHKNSPTKDGLNKVSTPSEQSQYASSRQSKIEQFI
jgi:transposase